MLCIRSLPGESASRDRVVTSPYTTAQAAQTRATTTPWFVRKLLNRNPPRSDWCAARGYSRAHLRHGSLDTSAYRRKRAGSLSCLPTACRPANVRGEEFQLPGTHNLPLDCAGPGPPAGSSAVGPLSLAGDCGSLAGR